jgi:predicted secreted protein
MSDAVAAFGTTITIDGVPIGELSNIGGPSMSGDSIDVSSHKSADGAGDRFREFLAGLKDAGEITMEGNWIPTDAGQEDLLDAYMASTTNAYVIAWPVVAPGYGVTVDAFVTRFEITGPHDGKLGFSATVKIDGAPLFA